MAGHTATSTGRNSFAISHFSNSMNTSSSGVDKPPGPNEFGRTSHRRAFPLLNLDGMLGSDFANYDIKCRLGRDPESEEE
jgi:hypothetical protein